MRGLRAHGSLLLVMLGQFVAQPDKGLRVGEVDWTILPLSSLCPFPMHLDVAAVASTATLARTGIGDLLLLKQT